jgi:hypothetical protein
MSIRTTVTLDEDVLARVKRESRSRGVPFRLALNDLLRSALLASEKKPRKPTFKVKATHMGFRPGLDYDNVESLLAYAEGEGHR